MYVNEMLLNTACKWNNRKVMLLLINVAVVKCDAAIFSVTSFLEILLLKRENVI